MFLSLAAGASALTLALAPAVPVQDLYDSGRLRRASCPEEKISHGGIPRTRQYLSAVVKCLDTTWSAHFKRAGLPFSPPVVRFYDEPEDRVCGVRWPAGAAAFYCTDRRTLVFPLQGRWIEERKDLYPFKIAAHEYGHHLQSLTGIRATYEQRVRARQGDHHELGRRYELQADCLAGAFIGGVWSSLGRPSADWTALVESTKASGDEGDAPRTHGTGTSRAYWLKRGFAATSPAACDTWKAPASRVS